MRKDRIPKLIQDTLSRFITKEMHITTFGAMIAITHVKLNPNQSLAKIYLSFLSTDQSIDEHILFKKITQEKNKLKKYLADELRHKLRTIPDLQFYIDNSAKQAIAIQQILARIN